MTSTPNTWYYYGGQIESTKQMEGECGIHRSDGTYTKFLVGNPEWKTSLQRLGYIWGIILKYILNM